MPEEDMEMEAAAQAEEGEPAPKKGFPLMKILILAGGVVILGAGGFFGWRFFFAAPPAEKDKPAVEEKAKDEKAKDEKAPAKAAASAPAKGAKSTEPEKPGNVLNLAPFIVNLADPEGKRYLKLTLAVDAKDPKLTKEIEARIPMIRDSILLLLTSKTYADIASTAGKIRLRNEILQGINRSLGALGSVHTVYFTEFVIQ
jgi:flagellar FliL protein